MHFALRSCSRRTTRANPCGMVCLPRDIMWSTYGLHWSTATQYGHQMINVAVCCCFSSDEANCSEVHCCPSFSSNIRGFGSLVSFSRSRAVSSLITLVGSSLRDGFSRVRVTDLLSLLIYSSTAGPNCLCASEIHMIWSMKEYIKNEKHYSRHCDEEVRRRGNLY